MIAAGGAMALLAHAWLGLTLITRTWFDLDLRLVRQPGPRRRDRAGHRLRPAPAGGSREVEPRTRPAAGPPGPPGLPSTRDAPAPSRRARGKAPATRASARSAP